MSHIICEKNTSYPIKSYSPNLMVHPYLYDSNSKPENMPIKDIVARVEGLLKRIHVIVVGPGLGRDPVLMETVGKIIEVARDQKMPIVIDADGLYLVQHKLDLIRNYTECVLTPNVVEFERLAKAAGLPNESDIKTATGRKQRVADLSNKLGGVIILSKGMVDIISDGETSLENDIQGSLKRVSGQGDTLSGALGTFMAWYLAYQNDLWKHDHEFTVKETKLLAAFAGSALTRQAAHGAFNDRGRAMTTSDVTEHVGHAFKSLYGGPKI